MEITRSGTVTPLELETASTGASFGSVDLRTHLPGANGQLGDELNLLAAVYEEIGIDVTYHQDGRILVESRPRVVSDGVGGASSTPSTRDPWETWLVAA